MLHLLLIYLLIGIIADYDMTVSGIKQWLLFFEPSLYIKKTTIIDVLWSTWIGL